VQDGYWWIDSQQGQLADLLRGCPQVLLGRHVAVTACDSGPLSLAEGEQEAGWGSEARIAFSPPIHSVEQLPRGGFDEWYVFAAPVRLADAEVFVNHANFSLLVPPSADETASWLRQLQGRFWAQLRRLRPESFLAEGDRLVFVTRDRGLYDISLAVLQATEEGRCP
jgi:hypothetical protein